MSIYTPPALNAVDFDLVAFTPADITPAEMELSAYSVPALSAVDFALTTYTPPTFPYVGWELLPGVGPVNNTLLCSSGSYLYAGQNAVLNIQRNMLLETGQYNYTGNAATFTFGRSMALDAGQYVYSGNDATLDFVPGITLEIPQGGSGYPVWRKKEPRSPSNNLDLLWDLVLSEHYEELLESNAPSKVKKQAAAIVKPFVNRPSKIPKSSQVDWASLEMDVVRVEKLLKILEEQGLLRAIDDDDETILLMMH